MGCGDEKLSKSLTQTFTAHCNAMICQRVTLPGDAEWPKVADAVIEASKSYPMCGAPCCTGGDNNEASLLLPQLVGFRNLCRRPLGFSAERGDSRFPLPNAGGEPPLEAVGSSAWFGPVPARPPLLARPRVFHAPWSHRANAATSPGSPSVLRRPVVMAASNVRRPSGPRTTFSASPRKL